MGRLAGFSYRGIVKRLKGLGLQFHRQAAGSHEIWFNPASRRYTTIPNHPGDMPEAWDMDVPGNYLAAIVGSGQARSKAGIGDESSVSIYGGPGTTRAPSMPRCASVPHTVLMRADETCTRLDASTYVNFSPRCRSSRRNTAAWWLRSDG